LPDEKLGECVAAFVVVHEGMDMQTGEVRTWVKERLSHHLGEFN